MSQFFSKFFTDFHFIRPWWLLALPLGLILLAGFKRREPGRSQWHKVCDQHLLEQLLVGEGRVGRKRIYGALLSMLILATLALAGPTWERLPQPLYQAAEGRVIVLDLSMSMAATDISPSRLTRARYKAIDLIKAGAGIEQGLVVFAGDSFIVAPLTDDRATLLNLLPTLNTDTVPVAGSRADRGLKKALELLQRATITRGQIILIADDADQETVAIAKKIKQAGHRIDVIAVGTKTGAPIALPDGGYLKNSRGEIVVPVPNFAALEKVASTGGGSYLTIDSRESAFRHLNQLQTLFPKEQKESKFTGDQWRDRGPWLLIPLLLLAALSFRKGWLLLVLFTLLPPQTASAFTFKDLWQRPEQQAAKAFNENNYKQAANLSPDPDWRAAALYRAGKFKEAAAALASRDSSLSHYNRGNALAKSGDLKQALAAYDKALAIDPGMNDARINRDLVAKILKKQEQKQQKNQQKQGKSDDRKKSDQNKKNDSKKSKTRKSGPKKDSKQKQGDQQQQSNQKQKSSKSDSSEKEQQQKSQSSQKQKNQESKSRDSIQNHPDKKAGEESAKPAKPEPKPAAKKPDNQSQDKHKQQALAEADKEKPLDAKHQALEQWLRRVPDDPGGLLQRKFLYQYRDRKDRSQGHKEW